MKGNPGQKLCDGYSEEYRSYQCKVELVLSGTMFLLDSHYLSLPVILCAGWGLLEPVSLKQLYPQLFSFTNHLNKISAL
jgi:hypothetical protein